MKRQFVPVPTARLPAKAVNTHDPRGRRAPVRQARLRGHTPRGRGRGGRREAAALFYHFRDKQALHDAVIEDIFGALVARLDGAFSMPTSIAARIEQAVEVWWTRSWRAPRSRI